MLLLFITELSYKVLLQDKENFSRLDKSSKGDRPNYDEGGHSSTWVKVKQNVKLLSYLNFGNPTEVINIVYLLSDMK